MRLFEDNDGVSPVIGTILMVAITVILSAVIAGFMWGVPTQIQKPWHVGVTVDVKLVPNNTVEVTMFGGEDFDRMILVKGSVNGDWNACQVLTLNSTPPLVIGGVMRCTGITPAKDHLIVVGQFNDGSEQVLGDVFL